MEGMWDSGIGIDAFMVWLPLLWKRSLSVTANTITMGTVTQDVRHVIVSSFFSTSPINHSYFVTPSAGWGYYYISSGCMIIIRCRHKHHKDYQSAKINSCTSAFFLLVY